MSNNWLAIARNPNASHAEKALVRYQVRTLSEQIGEQIQFALAQRFYDRKGPDRTLRIPLVRKVVAVLPDYIIVQIDGTSILPFSKMQMTSRDTCDKLSIAAQHRVYAMDYLPPLQAGGAFTYGLFYIVSLNHVPASRKALATLAPGIAAPKLDTRIDLDLSAIPASKLITPIGRTAEGDLLKPLTELLHVMVIGESGSGKSNWLTASLVALTGKNTPDQLRVALISPKRSEFAAWAGSPHAWTSDRWPGGIAASADEADRLILALRAEFDRRDHLFTQTGAKDLDGYAARTGQGLPRILVVADEMLDLVLMAPRGSKMMEHLAGFTSVARSHGFHVFLGSTKPRFDVLPTTLTDNIDNRVCFRVATANAARMVECPGAELIPHEAKGRAVARIGGRLIHLQAFLASEAGQPVPSAPTAPAKLRPISPREAQLVVFAVERLGGKFSINQLYGTFRGDGWSGDALRSLARQWEERGWLSAQAESGRGRAGARMVRPELEQLARAALSSVDAVGTPALERGR